MYNELDRHIILVAFVFGIIVCYLCMSIFYSAISPVPERIICEEKNYEYLGYFNLNDKYRTCEKADGTLVYVNWKKNKWNEYAYPINRVS